MSMNIQEILDEMRASGKPRSPKHVNGLKTLARQNGNILHETLPDGGGTWLQYASNFWLYCAVEALIDSGAKVNARSINGNTSLHCIFYQEGRDPENSNTVKTATMLLKYGAIPDLENNNRETPFYLASCSGFSKVAALLFKNGSGYDFRSAVLHGRLDVVEKIIASKSNPKVFIHSHRGLKDDTVQQWGNYGGKKSDPIGVMDCLLRHGLDTNGSGRFNQPFTFFLVSMYYHPKYFEQLIRLLVKHGCNLNEVHSWKSWEGKTYHKTLLDAANECDDSRKNDIVKILKSLGAKRYNRL